MSIFDRWTDLDPALALRRIEAAHGSAIFDRDSYTDPQRALRQIEDALSIELDDRVGLQDPSTLEAAIDAAVDTGSAPEWVPANAKIYIDLVNDRAWTEDDGVVAIDTLLGSDPNTVNGWNVTGYDPTFLTTDGYLPSASPTAVALIGAARTELLAGSTMRLLTEDADGSSKLDFFVVSTDGQDAIYASIVAADWKSASYNGELNQIVSGSINHTVGAKNCFAITLLPTRLDTAVNGLSPETSVLTTSDYPEAGLNACGFDVESINTTALQSITIYDALPSTTGLSALSEIA